MKKNKQKLAWLLAYANAQSEHYLKLAEGYAKGAESFKATSGKKYLLRWKKRGKEKAVTYFGGANRATRRALEAESRKVHGVQSVSVQS